MGNDIPFAAPPSQGQSFEVSPGVHWIRMPLPYAFDHISRLAIGPLRLAALETSS